MAGAKWQVEGQYYENCNCDFVCPCVPGQMQVKPTKDSCNFAMAFAIERGRFGDVPCPGPLTDWIEQLYVEGVTGGCQASPLLYCPGNPVLRGQMAAFLTKAFGLLLYGP